MKRSGETRRAKLFYLRERVGKATRLTEMRKTKKDDGAAADGKAAPAGQSSQQQAEQRELAASAT